MPNARGKAGRVRSSAAPYATTAVLHGAINRRGGSRLGNFLSAPLEGANMQPILG